MKKFLTARLIESFCFGLFIMPKLTISWRGVSQVHLSYA